MIVPTKAEISQWFDIGVVEGATNMIVVCDTFDFSDFPVYVMSDMNLRNEIGRFGIDMTKVMEVYDLSMDKEFQLNEYRAFHYGNIYEND